MRVEARDGWRAFCIRNILITCTLMPDVHFGSQKMITFSDTRRQFSSIMSDK